MKKAWVVLTVEDYQALLEGLDDSYCINLYAKDIEANEPGTPLEEYRKKSEKSTKIKLSAAKAMYDLYKALPDQVQAEVRKLINETKVIHKETGLNDLTVLANDSFGDIWNTSENEHWNDFIKARI